MASIFVEYKIDGQDLFLCNALKQIVKLIQNSVLNQHWSENEKRYTYDV